MIDFVGKEHYGFSDLIEITKILRSPGGCPWDIEQTHVSVRGNFLEEVYEAVDAIEEVIIRCVYFQFVIFGAAVGVDGDVFSGADCHAHAMFCSAVRHCALDIKDIDAPCLRCGHIEMQCPSSCKSSTIHCSFIMSSKRMGETSAFGVRSTALIQAFSLWFL